MRPSANFANPDKIADPFNDRLRDAFAHLGWFRKRFAELKTHPAEHNQIANGAGYCLLLLVSSPRFLLVQDEFKKVPLGDFLLRLSLL
jgi:hypothetical protein